MVLLDPALGPVYLLNTDVSDGFYHIVLHPEDASNMGLVLLSEYDRDDLVSIPFIFSTEYNNSPPLFYITDLENSALRFCVPTHPHKYYDQKESLFKKKLPALQPSLSKITHYPYLGWNNVWLLAYIDVFVHNFLGERVTRRAENLVTRSGQVCMPHILWGIPTAERIPLS